VDDSADRADSLALLLTVLGHSVRTAYDGPTALRVAGTFLPQVVFLDLGLPWKDSYEVARRLRQESGLRDALVVATTGFRQEGDCRPCQEGGFDRLLLNPFGLEELAPLLAACVAAVNRDGTARAARWQASAVGSGGIQEPFR
jgi:CheY-like chemotaxis protein